MGDEVEATGAELDLKALEGFLVGNRDLERLEALLDRFNILEALGVVRQELRHSDFLAFLMDPRGNHGLGDAFVTTLLQRIITSAEDAPVPVTPIELQLWDLGGMEVRREWRHIDILLLDQDHELAVIVENKIWSGEHSDQLRRYYRVVEEHHPGWRIVAVYLTPSGDAPSHEPYLPVDYVLVCEVIDGLAEDRVSFVNPDLKTLMTHYTDMLRRNVLSDSDVARLSRQIYRKHKRALDLIYEHRPDAQAEVGNVLEGLVKNEDIIERDSGGKNLIRFVVRDWDTPALMTSSGWTRSGRILMFEFWNNEDNLTLALVVGPGPDETREKLFGMARVNGEPFENPWKAAGAWCVIYTKEFLNGEMYDEARDGDREEEIRMHWTGFVRDDLHLIDEALKRESWIWGWDEIEEHPGTGRSG